MSDAQQQQFGVMPMSPMGLLQQAKIMTMDYGQAIQNSWLEQQKETAALYGGLSLDGSDSGEPGLVELYMSMAYEAADEQAHASRIEAYTSFAQAGVSAFQTGALLYKGMPDSSLADEKRDLPGLKEGLKQPDGSLVAQAPSSNPERLQDMTEGAKRFAGWDENKQSILDDLKKGDSNKYRALSNDQKKEFNQYLLEGDRQDVCTALDKRDGELAGEIKRNNADARSNKFIIEASCGAASRVADGIGKTFQSQATAAAAKLQADSQIMKDVSSQALQTEEAAKRQATQAQEGALQVAGWVITQVQA